MNSSNFPNQKGGNADHELSNPGEEKSGGAQREEGRSRNATAAAGSRGGISPASSSKSEKLDSPTITQGIAYNISQLPSGTTDSS